MCHLSFFVPQCCICEGCERPPSLVSPYCSVNKYLGLLSWLCFSHMQALFGVLPSGEDLKALPHLEGVAFQGAPGLRGILPNSWSLLTSLTYISVGGTGVYGPLPSSWSKLTRLRAFGLYRNPLLVGMVPPGWSQLRELRQLEIFVGVWSPGAGQADEQGLMNTVDGVGPCQLHSGALLANYLASIFAVVSALLCMDSC
jgi:hypothetical protein